jgi:hypothetical protein
MKNNLFEKCLRTALLVGLVALPTWAAETLFSNYAMNVTGSGKNGELWVFSRSGTYSGVTLLNLNAGSSGIQVNGSKQGQASDSMTAMRLLPRFAPSRLTIKRKAWPLRPTETEFRFLRIRGKPGPLF